jgi:putative protease
MDAGVAALKIEGRQRTKTYVAAMTGVLREAIDSCFKDMKSYRVRPEWSSKTVATFEGTNETLGSYLVK